MVGMDKACFWLTLGNCLSTRAYDRDLQQRVGGGGSNAAAPSQSR
jgi:hypothetical protein